MKKINKLRNKINRIDNLMLKLFKKRMTTSKEIGLYKKENNLSVEDVTREIELKSRLLNKLSNDELNDYYLTYLNNVISISKDYQNNTNSIQNVIVCNEGINNLKYYLEINKKTLIITEKGIPSKYVDLVKNQFSNAYVITLGGKEECKEYNSINIICDKLVELAFSKSDLIIGLGGGVITDITGYVGSIYKRGINYALIPTTLLAQVDASIGLKNGINYNGVKNVLGTFNKPLITLVDPSVLKTLDERTFNEGMSEIIKIAATSSIELFEKLEQDNFDLEEVIIDAINLKLQYVGFDLYDKNVRHVLNFGHTLGHAIEAKYAPKYLHGEAVAIGMKYFTDSICLERLTNLLNKFNLNYNLDFNVDELVDYLKQDKKIKDDCYQVVYLEEIGKASIINFTEKEFLNYLKMVKTNE